MASPLDLRIRRKSDVAKWSKALKIARKSLCLEQQKSLGDSNKADQADKQTASNDFLDDATMKVERIERQKKQAEFALAQQLLPVLKQVSTQGPEYTAYGKPNLSPEDLLITTISGAMTNTIYKLELKEPPNNSALPNARSQDQNQNSKGIETVEIKPGSILIRLYGDGTESFFSREKEKEVFKKIGRLNYGSHALLCEFENGRCEKFHDGSVPLEPGLMRSLPMVRMIGAEMGMFHRLNMGPPLSYHEAIGEFMSNLKLCYEKVVNVSRDLWALGDDSGNNDGQCKSSCGSSISDKVALGAIHELPALIDLVENDLKKRTTDPIVFGHNDLQPGNILINQNAKPIFIDFEYARFMPRGYDIANQWCEWAADYLGNQPHIMDYSLCPNMEQKRAFVRGYLEGGGIESEIDESLVDAFIQTEVEAYLPLSHLWWGIWGLLQVDNHSSEHAESDGKPLFDYLGYALCRMKALKAFYA